MSGFNHALLIYFVEGVEKTDFRAQLDISRLHVKQLQKQIMASNTILETYWGGGESQSKRTFEAFETNNVRKHPWS